MLLCLSREQRIAYLLGDLLRFTDTEGARICDISPATFRRRLARARAVMRQLMGQRCGQVRPDCDKLVRASMDAGSSTPPTLGRPPRRRGPCRSTPPPPPWAPPPASWTWRSR